MAVTYTQSPALPFDQAYGANPITLTGIPTDPVTGAITADKYVLQIWSNGTMIADLRQTPNQSAVAIFDIQNTLQNFVSPSINGIEETGYLGDNITNSAAETVPYTLRYGYEAGGVTSIEPDQLPLTTWLAMGGKKKYYEVPYTVTPYIPSLITVNNCSEYLKQAQPFSDLKAYRTGAEITDGKPAWLTDTMRVYDHYVTESDMTTISYWNGVSGTGPALAEGIEAFVFYQYDGNTLLSQDTIYNVQSEGGGPNTAPGQGITPLYPYAALTLGTGPKNFQDYLVGQATHYYVTTQVYGGPACEGLIVEGSLHYVHRFNIIQEGCNDYPEFQFSWMNSYGFRDYYSFRKRKDRSVAITRNNFLREAADYASTAYDVNIYDRGLTTYSQLLEEEYVAFTGYMSDADAKFLESLYTSADVKVRFDDASGADRYKWVPVELISAQYTEKSYRKDRLFQYEIRFKIAHNIKSQRG